MFRIILSVVIAASFASTLIAQVKTAPTPAVKPPFSRSLQAVVVTTDSWEATEGTARLYERKNATAEWKTVASEFPVVVGRNGLAWESEGLAKPDGTVAKREGDGKAPAGLFPLTFAFGAPEKPQQLAISYTRLTPSTECVDDPGSGFYNKIVDRFKVGNFDWKSSEKMLAVGAEYELGIFAAYNSYPVVPGSGSCIFLHIWKSSESPTAGCTAMARSDLERILGWIDEKKSPYLIQIPADAYKKNQRSWKLPKIK
jgi:D-alanyl-D-alanine dipeptidase